MKELKLFLTKIGPTVLLTEAPLVRPIGDRPLAKVARPEGLPKVVMPTNHKDLFSPLFGKNRDGINPRNRRFGELIKAMYPKVILRIFGMQWAT